MVYGKLRSGHRRTLAITLLCVAMSVGLLATSNQLFAQDVDLAKITAALSEWRGTFVNLRVVWEMWNPGDIKADNPHLASRAPTDPVFMYARHQWDWSDHGSVRFETWAFREGRIDYHTISGCEAGSRSSYDASFGGPTGMSESPQELQLRPMPSARARSSLLVVPLSHVYFAGETEWLDEVLNARKIVLDGYEDVGGIRCVRVQAARSPELVAWLDPSHGFLVARAHMERFAGHGGFHFEVAEFQRLPAGIWFPKRGSYRTDPAHSPDDVIHWVVTEVRLDPALPPNFFAPPAPAPGTIVEGTRGGKRHAVEDNTRSETVATELAEKAKSRITPDGPPVTATRPASRPPRWWVVLLAVSVIILGAATWLRRR